MLYFPGWSLKNTNYQGKWINNHNLRVGGNEIINNNEKHSFIPKERREEYKNKKQIGKAESKFKPIYIS